MNERSKEKRMRKCAVHLKAAILLLSGLTLFLFACEKEVPERGGRVVVDFSVSSADFEAGEDVVRSGNVEEPESVEISLGDDWYASATLEPAPSTEGGPRAAVSLIENQKVKLAAYTYGDGGSTPVSTATYTCKGGTLVADNDAPLSVDFGKYDFVAYSYFKTANEAPATSNIHPNKDLIWGKLAGKTISATDRSISITMYHRFAKVRLNVDTRYIGFEGALITEAGTIQMEGFKYANLASIRDGSLSDGSNLTYTANFPTPDGTNGQLNESERLFYSFPTKVTIAKISVKPWNSSTVYTFQNLSIPIGGGMRSGQSYAVAVKIRKNPWAYSNIYWDGSKLTFSEVSTDAHLDYQGVYFKWGSLIGIAPNGSGTIYVPNVATYPNYAGSGAGAWSSMSVSSSTWSNYAGIPRGTIPSGSGYIETDYGNYKGDICSYITNGRWSVPSREYFGGGTGYSHTYSSVSVSSSDGKASTGNAYVTYDNVGRTSFPASGHYYPSGSNDYFESAGIGGYYWSSYGEHSYPYSLGFSSGSAGFGSNNWQDGAMPVRCVR
jgi:hypothetical protein